MRRRPNSYSKAHANWMLFCGDEELHLHVWIWNRNKHLIILLFRFFKRLMHCQRLHGCNSVRFNYNLEYSFFAYLALRNQRWQCSRRCRRQAPYTFQPKGIVEKHHFNAKIIGAKTSTNPTLDLTGQIHSNGLNSSIYIDFNADFLLSLLKVDF